MAKKRQLYILVSQTQTGIARMIRNVSGYPYNHVSVTMDPSFQRWYSFARYVQDAPLYGGLVSESPQRLCAPDGDILVRAYRVEIPEHTAARLEKPDAVVIGEVWEDASNKHSYGVRRRYFVDGELDSVMNYPFYRAVLDFAVEGVSTATEFLGALGFQRGNTHTAAYPLLWNLMGSHDTPRLLHLCGGDRARHHLAAAIQLLSPGMPMIYYGDEVGMTGDRDPDCRRGMLWDRSRWDEATWNYYGQLLRIRKAYPALTEGRLVRQDAWDELSLVRITRELEGKAMTVLFHAAEGAVELPEFAGRTDLLTGESFTGTLSGLRALVFCE